MRDEQRRLNASTSRMTRRALVVLTLLTASITGAPGLASGLEAFPEPGEERPAYVKALEAAFGGPSQSGFGSTVLFATARDRDELISLARAAYRHFTGELWERWGGGNGLDGAMAARS